MSGEVELRRPIEADHRFLVNSVDDWWGGRKMHQLLPRLWLQHFTGTSWIAVVDDRIVGFLVGFISPDRPDEAYIHMVGTSPNHRDGRPRPDPVRAVLRGRPGAGRPARHGHHLARQSHVGGLPSRDGLHPGRGAGTQNLYGTPAYPDYDADGDDRVVFSREI